MIICSLYKKNKNSKRAVWQVVILLFFLSVFFLHGCREKTTSFDFSKINWLEGEWIAEDGKSYETWQKVNDSTFFAINYAIEDELRKLNEQINFGKKGNDYFFTPAVPTQNKGKGVPFILVQLTTKKFVVENSKHDFPKRISYELVTPSSLKATIEGDGKSIDFNFQRTVERK